MRAFMSAIVLVFAAGTAEAAKPTSLVIFGDSLVDAGNAFLATRNLPPQFQAAPASLGYFQGRFQEGPSYTDLISRELFGSYTVASLAGGTNFAVGGARAAVPRFFTGVPTPAPDITQQVGVYLQSTQGQVDPTGFYVINFGNNDVSALQSDDPAPRLGLTKEQYIDRFASNITGSISTLASLGARQFLVFGVPDPRDEEGKQLQGALNQRLDLLTPQFDAAGVTLFRYDAMAFFDRIRQDPAAFGITQDVDAGCIPARLAGGLPVDCTGYFSFDGIHPTARFQRLLAKDVGAFTGLAAIPEPSSWAAMILGFGLAGAALRRRSLAHA